MVGTTVVAFAPSVARAEVDVELLAGVHTFDQDNALGAGAPVTRDAAPLLGARVHWVYYHEKNRTRWYSSLLGAETEVGLMPTMVGDSDIRIGTVRAHAIVQFRTWNPDAALIPFVVVGGGAMRVLATDTAAMSEDTDGVGYAGVGARYRFGDWGARADARFVVAPSTGSGTAQDYEVMVSFYRAFGRQR